MVNNEIDLCLINGGDAWEKKLISFVSEGGLEKT